MSARKRENAQILSKQPWEAWQCLEKNTCSHRLMDLFFSKNISLRQAGQHNTTKFNKDGVIGSTKKPRILWANWVREWGTQLDVDCDSQIAPTVDRITPTRSCRWERGDFRDHQCLAFALKDLAR